MRNHFFERLFLILSVTASPGTGHAVSFTGLGVPAGADATRATGVSADGSVVVGDILTPGDLSGEQAFRWTASGGLVGLGYLPSAVESTAAGVSADGLVVVGSSGSPAGDAEAFRWTSAGGMLGLGFLSGSAVSYGTAVSADGSVVVGVSLDLPSGTDEAFRWTSDDGMVGLGFLPGTTESEARAASADGSVIVGLSFTNTGGGAFRWTSDGGMVGLGGSGANGVSADGSVVVGFDGPQAFRWTSDTGMVHLGFFPGGDHSAANAVSGDGSVVVGYGSGPTASQTALIWDAAHGMRILEEVLTNDYGLDLEGWSLEAATAISADGTTIVGYGYHTGSPDIEAWIAVIPEPGTGLLVITGLLGLAARRKPGT